MDLQEQLNKFGLELLTGSRRVLGALSTGMDITANDDQGKTYRISATNGQIDVTETSGPGLSPATVIVRKMPGEFSIPIQTLEPNPLNPRSERIFSLCVATEGDAKGFFDAIKEAGYLVGSPNVYGGPKDTADVEFYFASSASLDQLVEVSINLPQGVLIFRSLREIPNNNDQQQVKQDLLKHLNSELAKSEAWVTRNDGEGFPEAADSHRLAVQKWKSFIALVETFS